jgi:hypothetical protein
MRAARPTMRRPRLVCSTGPGTAWLQAAGTRAGPLDGPRGGQLHPAGGARAAGGQGAGRGRALGRQRAGRGRAAGKPRAGGCEGLPLQVRPVPGACIGQRRRRQRARLASPTPLEQQPPHRFNISWNLNKSTQHAGLRSNPSFACPAALPDSAHPAPQTRPTPETRTRTATACWTTQSGWPPPCTRAACRRRTTCCSHSG